MKINKNQTGSAIIVLLVILVLAVIGFGGYYVWRTQHAKTTTAVTTTTKFPAQLKAPAPAPDPTANWTAYSDATGKFSLRYPMTWVTATHPELCSPGLLLLGPTASSVGKCASEGFGEVSVLSVDGDKQSLYKLTSDNYTSLHQQSVTINDVSGVRQDGVAHGQQDSPGAGGLPDGTVDITYLFYTNGKTYVANYQKTADYPDVSGDFDLMVTKTLKFQ